MDLSLNKVWLVLAFFMVGFCESSKCPASDLIKPCVCENNAIYCGGNTTIDLVNIFQTLERKLPKTEKHFNKFVLENTAITEFKENTFKDITFDEITIENCENLDTIYINAFGETDRVTNRLSIKRNPRLSSPDNSIFEVISKFFNLETLELSDNNITEIPSNAFQPIVGYQHNLTSVFIGGSSFNRIGNKAFSPLNGLKQLNIFHTSIDSIPEFAFEFDEESDINLNLNFTSSNINSESFHQNSLTHFKRPVYLALGYWNENNLKNLDEKVFSNFFSSNNQNKLFIGKAIDCSNCHNLWLKKNPDVIKRIENFKCSSTKELNDRANFIDCPPYQDLKNCTFNKEENAIYCIGNNLTRLSEIFFNFSKELNENQKHFKKFYLNNTSVTTLEENTFSDLTFDEIYIDSCPNLLTINMNAFSATNLVTKKLWIRNNTKLSSPDNFITYVLSKFLVIEEIILLDNNFIWIPSIIPVNGYQDSLKTFKIGQARLVYNVHPLYYLRNLTELTFYHAQLRVSDEIIKLPDYAFEFRQPININQEPLKLTFDTCELIDSTSFTNKTFLNIRRPTIIKFENLYGTKYVTFLDEGVFLPFLLENVKNTIDVNYPQFDCNDCRNYWLKKHSDLLGRVKISCKNGRKFLDPVNFVKCKK